MNRPYGFYWAYDEDGDPWPVLSTGTDKIGVIGQEEPIEETFFDRICDKIETPPFASATIVSNQIAENIKLRDALKGLHTICLAVRYEVGLSGNQLKRMEDAKSLLSVQNTPTETAE